MDQKTQRPAQPQHNPANATYFPRVLGADGDAKLGSDEGVVNEIGHVLKRLAVVLTEYTESKINCM